MRPLISFFLVGILGISGLFAQVFDITDYGASPELADNSAAIHRAAAALGEHGGGTLMIPAGTFRSGKLHLTHSHLHLHLAPGAVLQANPEAMAAAHKPGTHKVFLKIEAEENVSLTGPGTIKGTGADTLGVSRFHSFPPASFRYNLVSIEGVRHLRVRDLNLVESEMFTLHLIQCVDVVIDGVIIRNNYYHPNTDGIDLNTCTNVHISNCHVTAGDDGICFKRGSERVLITNCTIETPSTAIKFGTNTDGVFRNIRVSNCVLYNSMVGVGVLMKDGGTIEHCTFSDLQISNIADTLMVNSGIANQQVPIYIDLDYRDSTSKAGSIRHITFEDIDIHSEHPILMQGLAVQPIENLTLRNIRFNVRRGYDLSRRKKPKGFADKRFWYHDDHRLTVFARKEAYVTLANVQGLNLDNLQVWVEPEVQSAFPRYVLGLYGVEGEQMGDIRLMAGGEKVENLVERD